MRADIGRIRRHQRSRRKVVGTMEKPRLSVYRSVKYFYAQLVDDMTQKTIFTLSTKRLDQKVKKTAGAAVLGKLFATEAKAKGFSRVVFDRGGYLYHGRIKAFADACRENGLMF